MNQLVTLQFTVREAQTILQMLQYAASVAAMQTDEPGGHDPLILSQASRYCEAMDSYATKYRSYWDDLSESCSSSSQEG